MPHLIVRGISPEKLCIINDPLIDELVEIIKCPKEYFELESIHTTAIRDGAVAEPYPFVEVAWFDRGQEVQDQVAAVITRHVNSLGIAEVGVAFKQYYRNCYYENGEHF